MTYITVVDDSPAGTVENLDKLMTDILPEPDGLAARYAGMVDGKLCIVAIWDSADARPDLHDAAAGPRRWRSLLGAPPAAPVRALGMRGRALLRAVAQGLARSASGPRS